MHILCFSDAKHKQQTNVVDFDEALSRLGKKNGANLNMKIPIFRSFPGFGKFNYILILVAGVIITATSFETLGISFVFPVAECDLTLTTQNKGVLSGITSIGIIASSNLWGFLADRKGRKSVIVPTLVLSFISSFFSSLSTNFGMLVVCRFFCGFL